MKSRLIDAAAFLIGAIAVFMQGGVIADSPWPIRLALTILSPGYLVGFPIVFLAGAIGLASLSFFFLVSILVNGLIFGLTSYLIRNSIKGQRVARVALAIGMGVWITWGAKYTIGFWPWPERVVPVDLSSPIAGRWKGVFHSQSGDLSIVLVCHPHADSTLDGYIYIHGWDMGPFENGVYTRDSLRFEIIGTDYGAHFDNGKMTLVIRDSGQSNGADLRFVSADTTRPPPAPVDLASPLTGRWDGVLTVRSGDRPVVLICHPYTDQVLNGYLYISGMDMGEFLQGVWIADSLRFWAAGFQHKARFDSTTMIMERSGKGMHQSISLRFVGADTTRPAIHPSAVFFPP
jgi:hypothetical protein